jgi:hypothetical protein
MHTVNQTQNYSPVNMTDKASMTNYIAGGLTAAWGMLTFEHVIGIAGIIIGLTGLAVNTYYKHKQDMREQERHLRFMQGPDNPE